MKGYIYILQNESMGNLLKIGVTTRTPEQRAQELSMGTGVPTPFVVAHSRAVPNAFDAESMLHARLATSRLRAGREFFDVPLEKAKHELDGIVSEMAPSFLERMFRSRDSGNTGKLKPASERRRGPRATSESKRTSAASTVNQILREHFGKISACSFYPRISDRGASGAMARFGGSLNHAERLVMLYDATWFSSGSNGFIVTDGGIAWTSGTETPAYSTFREFQVDRVVDGWLGFYIQNSFRADVWATDRKTLLPALKNAMSEIKLALRL